MLRLQDRHAEAEAALRRALALRPADAGACNDLALLLDEQDRPHEALRPGMRLLRQDARRRWEPVIATVASTLADLRRLSGRG